MTLHGPPVRAPSHRTIWFALAACASFGLAIRDTLRDRAPRLEHAGEAAPPPPAPPPNDSELAECDSVPSAAELAEADEEFARAAAARAADKATIGRALRSLLAPEVAPASWLALADPPTADRLAVLARLGIDVAVADRRTLSAVEIRPAGASHVACADLEAAAIEAWGDGRAGALARRWAGDGTGYGAVLQSGGGCALRLERRVTTGDALIEAP